MSQPIIEVRGLSKRYRLGAIGATSLREEVHRTWNRLRGVALRNENEFWALRDVSFDVNAGEVIGIVGRNGAGKSTLLKVLSRITAPTTGSAILRGRVGSLLEVGTGFHPELTGRENTYLNGAILGMTRAEVRKKFDEIVAFAEVEQFIDTPVKRYSSGMYVRLAFAVAAHLEPEILLVDEVLAVGDTAFQQKCLKKIGSISNAGRTVLFVSHSLSTLRQLCDRGVLLDHGAVRFVGTASETLDQYIGASTALKGRWGRTRSVPTEPGLYFKSASLRNAAGETASDLPGNETFSLELEVGATARFDNAQIAVRFTNQEGIPAFTTCNTDVTRSFETIVPGQHCFRVNLDAGYFMPGRYSLKIAAHIPESRVLDLIDDEITFTIHDLGTNANALKDKRLGVLCPVFPWIHTRQ